MKNLAASAALIGLLLGPAQVGAQDAGAGKGIVITPKYFEPSVGTGQQGGLGFTYRIDKTVATPAKAQELSKESFHKLDLDFKAEGNVAFNRDINPSDFLKTGLELNYVYQYASAVTLGGPGSGCDPTDPATLPQCREEAARSRSGDALVLFTGLIGSLESDQRFDRRNETFGAHLTTVYRPAPGSFANQANPLDWPFRLARWLTGHPMGLTASPDAFPKLRLALERVQPGKDPDRTALLGDPPDYDRANIEIAMSSPLGVVQGKQVKFEWSWRYFKEQNPAAAIEAAGLDRHRYAAATLRHDSGWQLTYATGKLPLDRQSDAVWELGYRVEFD